jgi:hypothetical protein
MWQCEKHLLAGFVTDCGVGDLLDIQMIPFFISVKLATFFRASKALFGPTAMSTRMDRVTVKRRHGGTNAPDSRRRRFVLI